MPSLLKNLLISAVILGACFTGYKIFKEVAPKKQKVITITQIAPHPSLDKIYQGIIDELNSWHEISRFKIIRENAQGNLATASQIAQKFLSLKPVVAIPISTPSAQSLCAKLQHIQTPVVFAAVSDPIASKVTAEDYGSISGVTDPVPIEKLILLMKKVVPHLKTLGTLFNPSEASSNNTVKRLEELCAQHGIKLISLPVNRSLEVPVTVKGLVNKVDALFMGTDNTVVLAVESLIQITKTYKIPFFVSDPESVKRGALAGIVYDEYQIGRDVGKIVRRVLKGEPVRTIPITTPSNDQVVFNEATAKDIGVLIPHELLPAQKAN